jgi:hypothetical protein
LGVTINLAFFPAIPFTAEINDVVSIEPYKRMTDTVYTRVRKGFNRNAHVIKSFSIGEKKNNTVGTTIQPVYALPKSIYNKGAIVKFAKMKKANTAVRGRL